MDVIDADGHIVEKETDMRAYLPEPHCKSSGSLLPSDGQDSLMGGRLGSRTMICRRACATWIPRE